MALFERAGWLIRADSQFHWMNEGFASFDDFLATLASRKRKAIRKERAQAVTGLEIVHLTGAAITEAHWDAFWAFYQDTGARKWGQPYLTRAFFSLLGARLGERVLLILASRDGAPIAGALNLIGADALYGRYWAASRMCRTFISSFAITRRSTSRSPAPWTGRGRCAGVAQIGAGLPAGADLLGPLYPRSAPARRGGRLSRRERPRGRPRNRRAR